jgi:PDZ domain
VTPAEEITMKRMTHGLIAFLLGLAPAALASPNQPQSWNEQNAWNEQHQQNQQNQQNEPQGQNQQPQTPEQEQWGGRQDQGPWRNQPLPPPNQQAPRTPAWQQPVPNAGWQNQAEAWSQDQGPMQNQRPRMQGPHLGIIVEGLTPELRSYFGAPSDRGLLVARIEPRSPAARAGLQVGDVLIAVQGQPVNSANDVLGILSELSPNEMIRLDLMRSGRQISLMTQLRPRPQMFRGQQR